MKKRKVPTPKRTSSTQSMKTEYAKYPKVNPGLTGGKKGKK